MAQWPEADWTHSPEGHDTDGGWDKVDKEAATVAFKLLDLLSRSSTSSEADSHGWTADDFRALSAAQEFDWIARLVVPPEAVSVEHRMENMELMAEFRTALPFAEAERKWLFDDYRYEQHGSCIGDPKWNEAVRRSESSLVSAGLSRVVHGRDLLQRWWSWRRETGEYAGQGSLDQARSALEGVIALLSPELGLPETYVALRGGEDEQATPSA